jgi:hypothetical protein
MTFAAKSVAKVKVLERERAFAHRRLNLMRVVTEAASTDETGLLSRLAVRLASTPSVPGTRRHVGGLESGVCSHKRMPGQGGPERVSRHKR